MVMLLEGSHLQFFVHKKLDPSNYIWAMPIYTDFCPVLQTSYSVQVLLEAIFIQST